MTANALNREERLQEWYREARIGLFLHWGMITGDHEEDPFGPEVKYPYETAEAFEIAAAEAGWSAERWVSTAKRLRAKYMTIGTFHCELGYLKIWPSRVPGSPSTRRDFLRELIDAAAAESIRVIVYINRDAKNAFHGGVQWLDLEAYRAYKRDPVVDVTTRNGFLAYSMDVMEEVLERYPDGIDGFWFDGYHDKEESQRVFARLHRLRPNLVLINNDFSSAPVEDEDAMALEDFGKLCEPTCDLASGTWVGPGDKEFAFKTKWDWFYLGEGRPHWKGYGLNYANVPSDAEIVRWIVSVAGSSWNAQLGYGPKIGGDFPKVLEAFTAHFDRFMSWAHESIFGTVGGGYGQGGFPPGHWNDGAYGVTTIVPGTQTHYVHVLIPPDVSHLKLSDAGYEVTQAIDLKTGEALAFRQEGGRLTIAVPSWDAAERDGVTVVKLTTDAERRIVPSHRITASATSELPYRPASHVLDGKYDTYFRGAYANAWPQFVTLKLDERCEISGLCVTQPETGPVRAGGFAAPAVERIQGYEVHVSDDGVSWGAPAATGELRNQRGMQVIPFGPVTASHVRFTALGNYGGTGTFQLSSLDILTPS